MDCITGTCLCGQIAVSVTKQALNATDKTYICRCKNCRQTSGSFASTGVIVANSDFKITGEPKLYQDRKTDSGTSIQRAFCGSCGSPIYTASPTMPGVQIFKLGLFDQIPKPSMELYCRERPSWDKAIPDTIQFEAMPTKRS